MKVSGLSLFQGFSEGVAKLLRSGNGLIDHQGESRYTAHKSSRRVALNKGKLHTIESSGGILDITALTGFFWITCEGDPKDYTLKAGDSLHLNTTGKIIIEALHAGEMDVSNP
jgi:hypothetical protein